MMDELKIYRGREFKINEKIIIKQPTIKQIENYGEQEYYNLVFTFITRPYDVKVQLFDAGFDYEQINDYEYFLSAYKELCYLDTTILFSDLNFNNFEVTFNEQISEYHLYDKENNIVIDKLIYYEMADFVRTIHHLPKKIKDNPGNSTTKKFLIERERRRMKKNNKKEWESVLVPMISSVVWNNGAPKDFDDVWNLTIYQLKDGLLRKNQIKEFENMMLGAYTGVLNMKKVNIQDINWCGKINIEPKELNTGNSTVVETK